MSKYSKMSADELLGVYKKKQRHLIIPNIIIMIMAIVVIICSFSMPMLKMTIHLDGEGLTEFIDVMSGDTSEGETESATEEAMQLVEDALKDIDVDFVVAINPMDVIDIAVNGGKATDLIAGMLGDVTELVETVIAQVVPNLVETFADSFVDMMTDTVTEETGYDFDEETIGELKSVFTALSDNDADSAKESFATFINSLKNDPELEIDDDTANEIITEFSAIIDDSVDENGDFTYIAFIGSVIDYVAESTGEEGAADDSYSEMQELIASLENLDAESIVNEYLGETIDDETNDMIVMMLFAVVLVTVGLCAALWAILFLFDFFHTISKNRRFTTWYVKLLAWIPAFIFFLLPTVAISVLPSLIGGETAAMLTTLFEAVSVKFGGSGIVSGICYLLLWVMSIFWLFPIKHGIRKSKKQLKKLGVTKKQLKGKE